MHQRNLNPPTDADLLHDFATARSEPAFRALADRHAPWVYASAFRQLHDRHLAEDAAQAVFLLLAQKAHAMSEPQKRNLPGWLFNTLHYILRNLRRAHRARRKHEQQLAQQSAPQSTDPVQPPDPAEAALLANTLDAAVAKLSTPDRTAILLRFYQNRPIDDIAHALNISEPAARKRLTRAIAKLRHHLTRNNPATVGGLQNADALSTATLTLAATHGLLNAPATLPATIAQLAASSAAGGGLPVTLAATIKGASTLMATAKLQTAIISTALALAIFVTTTLLTIHLITRPSTNLPTAPSPTTPIAAAPNDQPAPDAEPTYTLAPDQIIALIPPPFPDSRHAVIDSFHQYRQQTRAIATTNPSAITVIGNGAMQFQVTSKRTAELLQSGGGSAGGGGGGIGAVNANGQSFRFTPINHDPDAMILITQDNLPPSLSSERQSTSGNNFFTIHDLLQSLFNLTPDAIEGQKYLLDRKIPGDFLVRKVPPQQLLPALEKLLSEQLDSPVTLSLHDIPTTTYVLAGTWKTNPDGSLPTLHLYTDDNSDESNMGNGMLSPANAIVTALTRLLHAPVSIDTTNTPPRLTYITHRMPRNPDPAILLNHLAEQTGLTWSKQSLPQRHISIDPKN